MKGIAKYIWLAVVLLTIALFLGNSLRDHVRQSSVEEAKHLVAKVYSIALAKSGMGKQLEMRFYMSSRTWATPLVGGHLYDSLQPFQINSDGTCSPMGERVHLPKNIVLLPACSSEGLFSDSNKQLSTIRIDGPEFAEYIVFYDLAAAEQIPEKNRSLVVLNGKIYSSAEGLPLIVANVPGFYDEPSRPVRQP